MTAQATSDSAGAATFRFISVTQGLAWTGVVSVPTAPTTAVLAASVGTSSTGDTWGSWAGNATFGPVQAISRETIVVTAAGLAASTSYTALFIGQSEEADVALPVFPTALATAVSASTPVTVWEGASARRAAVQSIPDAATTAIIWDTVDLNTETPAFVTAGSSTITAQLAGVYLITVTGSFAANAAGIRGIYASGGAIPGIPAGSLAQGPGFAGGLWIGSGSAVASFAAGATFTIGLFQNTGGPLDATARLSLSYLGT